MSKLGRHRRWLLLISILSACRVAVLNMSWIHQELQWNFPRLIVGWWDDFVLLLHAWRHDAVLITLILLCRDDESFKLNVGKMFVWEQRDDRDDTWRENALSMSHTSSLAQLSHLQQISPLRVHHRESISRSASFGSHTSSGPLTFDCWCHSTSARCVERAQLDPQPLDEWRASRMTMRRRVCLRWSTHSHVTKSDTHTAHVFVSDLLTIFARQDLLAIGRWRKDLLQIERLLHFGLVLQKREMIY